MNFLKQKYRETISKIVPPPTQSVFETEGRLTPEEFQQSGDELINNNPNWRWETCTDKKKKNSYLNENK